jgi:hypothetical protein
MRARVCACGCGKELRKQDGTPDFSARRFFDRACLARTRSAACRRCARWRRRSGRPRCAIAPWRRRLPQQREWYQVGRVRIGVFSAQAFQYFEKHPELAFAKPKLVPVVVIAGKKKVR